MLRPCTRMLLALSLAGAAPAARAAEFTVNATFDATDVAPGDGSCATDTGEITFCTLRAAIMEANALSGADTIVLPAGSYDLYESGAFENGAATGDLDIDGPLAIVGAGRDVTVVDAVELGDRVFEIHDGGLVLGTLPVSISGLTITRGEAPGTFTFGSVPGGGGLLNEGHLTLDGCRVSFNQATSFADGGGGILNEGTLIVAGSEIHFNSADDSISGGGGLLNLGAAVLEDSSFTDNSAEGTGGGGGGIANLGTLTATRCAVGANSAADSDQGGGGVYHAGMGLSFTDGTISENDASVGVAGCGSNAGGGGLSIFADFVFVSGSTINDNTVAADCEGQPDGGAGVHAGPHDYLFFVNTTISGNTASGAERGGGGLLCLGCLAGLFNCTVSDNRLADDSGFPSDQFGGGLSADDEGQITYENTIVLGNRRELENETTVADDCAADESSALTSNGYNLLGGEGGCPATSQGDQLVAGTSGVLAPLADNGGPTLTHALVPGSSPAIDAGDPAGCSYDTAEEADLPLETDQRGFGRPADGNADTLIACDVGAYELAPANPPDCSRLINPDGPSDEIVGLATDDDRAADTGIYTVELLEGATGVALVGLDFGEGDPTVTFVVECVDPTPDDGLCAGTGVVRVTDGEGLTCTLGVEFTPFPAGPLEGFVICQGDGTLLQIDHPLPDSGDAPNLPDTGSCSVGDLNDDVPPLPPGRAPVEECDVFVIESPVAGLTSMVYKVEINNLNLRLLFSEFDTGSSSFLVWEDITQSVELIPEVIPDPTRMQGTRQWSPVMITCAEQVAVDCNDPLNVDADRDGDGFSPCPSDPQTPADCDDNIGFVFPGAFESCNGIDDDCDGAIDEGFDADGDTAADCFDNCLGLSNPPEICDPALPPFQCDSDGDGLGDACDEPDDEDGDDEQADEQSDEQGDDEQGDDDEQDDDSDDQDSEDLDVERFGSKTIHALDAGQATGDAPTHTQADQPRRGRGGRGGRH